VALIAIQIVTGALIVIAILVVEVFVTLLDFVEEI
jgi:hypothetical protein